MARATPIGRTRRVALSDLTANEIARLRWRLADAAFARGERQAAREHALAATSSPTTGRPRNNERTPQPWTIAIRARRDREIAERVEYWRAWLVRERPRLARADARRRNAQDVSDTLRRWEQQAREAGMRRTAPPAVRDVGKPSEIAERIVAWELMTKDDPLTPAAVHRRATRARARKPTS
jgi:hypothetical protein